MGEGHRRWHALVGDLLVPTWERLGTVAAIGPRSRRARRFASFGDGSRICFPVTALFGESAIRIGAGTVIGPGVSLAAGMAPDQSLVSDSIVTIGDGCVIGRNASIVGHLEVVVGDDVFTGPGVYITDQNHGWEDLDVPVGRQAQPEQAVHIGAGSWLGAGAVVLPGVTLGRHVVVGAGCVVTRDVPDHSVVVGNPARVVQRWSPSSGWEPVVT